jgi:hypothetical protein
VRRGAAWPPAERPSSCPVVQQAVSRAGRWPHRQAVMLAERRVCRPQQHGSVSQRRRSAQDVRMPTVALIALSTSACPASARSASARPVSGVRYVSSVRPSGVRPSGCPVPGVRACDVHASAVQYPGVDVRRPASVSARSASASAVSAPVTSWSASERRAATQPGRGPGLAVLLYPRTARPSA